MVKQEQKQEELVIKDKHHAEGVHEGSCLAWTLRLEPWRLFTNVGEAMETKVYERSKKGGVKVVDRENQTPPLNNSDIST